MCVELRELVLINILFKDPHFNDPVPHIRKCYTFTHDLKGGPSVWLNVRVIVTYSQGCGNGCYLLSFVKVYTFVVGPKKYT